MVYYSLEEQLLELKYTWKISRNSSDTKTNYFVNISDGNRKGLGEIAPNVRYGENGDLIKQQFNTLLDGGIAAITNLNDFSQFCSRFTICNSLRFGLESAFVHYLSNKAGQNVSEFLGLEKPKEIFTAFKGLFSFS